MVEALRHQAGGEGITRHGPLTLVHARLAIIDVEGGDQPLDSEDSDVSIVVNGEIYNHVDLRAGLEKRGHRFSTHSDSEVVAHLYEERRPGCVEKPAALALVRPPAASRWQRATTSASSRSTGAATATRIAVASRVGALLAAGLVRAEVDEVALDHFLACRFVPAPRDPLQGDLEAPAGLGAGGRRRQAAAGAQLPGAAGRDHGGRAPWPTARRPLRRRGRRQMMSDVPYGYGVIAARSTPAGVVAAMAKARETPANHVHDRLPGRQRPRRAGGGGGERAGDRHRAPRHGDGADGFSLSSTGRCIPRLEEPCGIRSARRAAPFSRFARDVKVVLAGQGADEPHGDYGRHQAAALHLQHVPGFLAGPAAAAARASARASAGAPRTSWVAWTTNG